jgi:hypothetical protein
MHPQDIVSVPPIFDHHMRLEPVTEQLHRDALIQEFTVRRFVFAFLPEHARFGGGSTDINGT